MYIVSVLPFHAVEEHLVHSARTHSYVFSEVTTQIAVGTVREALDVVFGYAVEARQL